MKKVLLSLATVSLTMVACSDDAEKQRQLQAQQYVQQQQYAQQQQYMQPQYAQPQVVQPQVVQAPAQPVIVQQQHDNTLTNMALGAVIGHTIANMGGNDNHTTERIVEHKTVVIDNRQPSTPQPYASSVAPVPPVTQPTTKPSAMDMNKLSASANQTFNTGTTPVKSNTMDMSKLSSKPSVSLAKPSSMNMSKLGKK